ncbi:MAG: ATP-binding cassette domain-containing protein [Acidimicrobiia bacterium]|nr:ATP-binding cassette domain-containing protein [Acidimicrobiia bacterium]
MGTLPPSRVAANVGYGLTAGREAAEVEDTLAMVGLEGLGRRMPATLSGGQQQRVALARALAPHPDVLLLDEPFSNLDAALRNRVRSETHRLLGELGTTALFVTHDQAEAFVMGDEVAVMESGSIRQQADPGTLYDQPIDPWVAGFVGDANLLQAVITEDGAETRLGIIPVATSTGGAGTILVRPEYLHLDDGDEGRVTHVEFYGHDISYMVELEDVTLTVRAMQGRRFRPGDAVSVRFEGPPVVVYPTEELVPVP